MECDGTAMLGFDIVDGKGRYLTDQVRCAKCQSILPKPLPVQW